MIYLCILFGVFLIIGIGISNHKKWATSWLEYDLTIFELYSNIKKANAGDAKAAYHGTQFLPKTVSMCKGSIRQSNIIPDSAFLSALSRL